MKDKKKEFGELYLENITPLFRFIRSKVNNDHQAEEITSSVIEVAYKKYMSSDEEIKNGKAWLFRITIFTMTNAFRKKKYESSIDAEIEIVDRSKDISKELIEDEDVEKIKSAMDSLEPQCKEVLQLKVWEDMKFLDIAKVLDINESTAKTLYYRGLDKIKKIVSERSSSIKVLSAIQYVGNEVTLMPSADFIFELINRIDPQIVKVLEITIGSVATATGIAISAGEGAMGISSGITIFGKTFSIKEIIIALTTTAVVTTAGVGTQIAFDENKVEPEREATCFEICSAEELLLESIENSRSKSHKLRAVQWTAFTDQDLVTEIHYENDERYREKVYLDPTIWSERVFHDGDKLVRRYEPGMPLEPLWETFYSDTITGFMSVLTYEFKIDAATNREFRDVEISENIRNDGVREIYIESTWRDGLFPVNTIWKYYIQIDKNGLPVKLISETYVDDKLNDTLEIQFSEWGVAGDVVKPFVKVDPNSTGSVIISVLKDSNGAKVSKICLEDYYSGELVLCTENTPVEFPYNSGISIISFTPKVGAYLVFVEYENGDKAYFTNKTRCENSTWINCHDGIQSHNKEVIIINPNELIRADLYATDFSYNECAVSYSGLEYCNRKAITDGDPRLFFNVWKDSTGLLYRQEYIRFKSTVESDYGLQLRIPKDSYVIEYVDIDGIESIRVNDGDALLLIQPIYGTLDIKSFGEVELLDESFTPNTYRIKVEMPHLTESAATQYGYGEWYLYDNRFSLDYACGENKEFNAPCGYGRMHFNNGDFFIACQSPEKYSCDRIIERVEAW